MKSVFRLLMPLLLLTTLCVSPLFAMAEKRANQPKYYDIYLSGDRVCEKCTWRLLPRRDKEEVQLVELINREGASGVYPAADIIGVDANPLMRKLLLKGVAGMGLAGEIIVPQAFENVKDHTCKYCGER